MLVDEVWLVVVLAVAATAFPVTDHRAWANAAATLLPALLLSFAQFALLLLGPVFRRQQRPRRMLCVLGCLGPFAWSLALGDVAGAPWLAAAAFGCAAVAAVLLLGVGFMELPTRTGAARWRRPAWGAAVLALLIASALALAPKDLLSASGDGATLQLLAWSLVVVLPLVVTLQAIVWRWALARWLRGEGWVPIHAVDRPVPMPAAPMDGAGQPS